MFCYRLDALFVLKECAMPLVNGHFAVGRSRIEANQISSLDQARRLLSERLCGVLMNAASEQWPNEVEI